ncbi:MAG: insulinase family protein [Clostridium sp.]|jgi:Zn-dependent M16 (insulinase) family peptidase|nr:insulinase family protein [Clostridium sp.]
MKENFQNGTQGESRTEPKTGSFRDFPENPASLSSSIETLASYEIIERRRLGDLASEGCLLRHKKSGARVVLLSNQDENKVFYIGFRTPPKDSTGVAHILEHSVLCGSREFPVKDPFIELAKGSLNTFLNAMTYPDKTVYPVSSCNNKDFQNLLHVYLDAVFHPKAAENPNIFRQEGWHYELSNETDELKINGVVYNEMRGAFSSPDDVLERQILNSLYPDVTYGNESGGDPEVIPSLTYEQFLDFYRRFYHPSNSYLYLYGDMDMAEKLAFLDERYLSAFDEISVDSRVGRQEPPQTGRRVVKEYPIGDGEKEKENGYLSWNLSIGDSLDKELYVAFQILDYALCSAPGAPVKKALTDRGIGKEIYSTYENGVYQPYFSVVSKNVDTGKEKEFLDVVQEILRKVAAEGFDRKALLAGISYFEFKYREADFGSYPKGLIYGLQILDSWLYDDRRPFLHVEANETFAFLRSQVENGYFEKLLETYLLSNQHCSVVVLEPKKGLSTRKEEELKEKLAARKAAMGAEELRRMIEDGEALKTFQETPDSREDLEKIPVLKREDLKKEAASLLNEERRIGDTKVLFHDIFTNGIGYLRLIFRLREIPGEFFAYVGVLKGVLGLLNTEHYEYGDLFHAIHIATGGMSPVTGLYSRVEDPADCTATLELKTKVLYGNLGKAFALLEEILFTSDFTHKKRIYEILAEGKSAMQAGMMSSGHSIAVGRALSYGSVAGALSEELTGHSFYRLLSSLEEHFEEKAEDLCEKLARLAKMVFRPENLMVDFTGTQEGYACLEEPLRRLREKLYTEEVPKERYVPKLSCKNEGFMTPGEVQYVCRAGNFRRKGLPYRGELRVLKVMLGYAYLWNKVRVKGGAYGCMCGFGKSGDSYFVSYRDPNLKDTITVYEEATEAVAGFRADERTMTQYIIGAVSELDMPMNPAAKGLFSLSAYMTGITQDTLQQERDEVLAAKVQDIRELAAYIQGFLRDGYLCVVGNARRIQEEQKLFRTTEDLL